MPDAPFPAHLRAVIFDVDGTLYRQGPVRRAMVLFLVRAHLRRPLVGLTTARILSAYRRGQEALRDSPRGGNLAQTQLMFASRETGLSPERVQHTVAQWMDTAPLPLLRSHAQPGMQEFVTGLRANGLKLGVFSDYPAEAKLDALGIGGLFDSVLCAQADDVGVFKPDPRGILLSLERLGVGPAEALYIGDRADVDAQAARAAGVACAILTTKPSAHAAEYIAVPSFAELDRRMTLQYNHRSITQGAVAP